MYCKVVMIQIVVCHSPASLLENPVQVIVSGPPFLATDLQQSGSINRVGTVPPPLTPPPTERSCPTNYSRIGDNCYYVSMWHDYRSIWKVRDHRTRMM